MEGDRKVNPNCVNAGNPFHQCADYCKLRTDGTRIQTSVANGDKIIAEARSVDPNCINASNPFHQCADYCTKKTANLRPDSVVNGEKIIVEARNVDPNCVNASNPFHQCGDYCVKKTADSKKPESGRFAFPVLLKQLSPRSSSGRSDGSKSAQSGERVRMEGRNVDPSCVNASNPFHQCGDQCMKTADVKKPITMGKAAQNGELREEEIQTAEEEERKVDPRCANASNPTEYSQGTQCVDRQTNGHTLEITQEP